MVPASYGGGDGGRQEQRGLSEARSGSWSPGSLEAAGVVLLRASPSHPHREAMGGPRSSVRENRSQLRLVRLQLKCHQPANTNCVGTSLPG